MKVSEAIQKLSDILHEDGDLDLIMITEMDDVFVVEYGRELEVIDVSQELNGKSLVCAFMEPDMMEPDPGDTHHKLRMIKGGPTAA